jgi:uridine kinase
MEFTVFPKDGSKNPLALIESEEKRYRDQLDLAAEQIVEKNARFVFLAGPSCSGKTTTSLALRQRLSKKGFRAMTFSTDDFFFDYHVAPKNEDGTPNFDAFEHTDSELLIHCINSLSRNETVGLPTYDFISGYRKKDAFPLSGKDFDIFIVEGIHALNDRILNEIDPSLSTFKLYLDVTKGVKLEESDATLSPERVRFLRRLIRDFKHRNASADRTFSLWKNVLDSEKIILHPFRKNASFTIETNFSYEISVEKQEAFRLLSRVKETSPFYEKALEIKIPLSHFPDLGEELVPENSVLREFID